ncbi:TIGR00299 family protein [archaeon 13_1_20CM_2_51_12]|nr:MAG: TIGR00299 family protein [Crenarchaeota archaeon 13_1_40CM_3_52_17]OLE68090.1 MAG: TIGR00299 family protein [archaeon 13_1_20CM_2_51_12]
MRASGRAVIIDASSSGASGDKFLGALIDLGGNPKSLERVARVVEANLSGASHVQVKTTKVERGEIGAQLVEVRSEEKVSKRKATDLQSSAEKCAKELGLSEWGTAFVKSVLDTLSSAESRVHGHSTKEVELRELGSADTLVDILGVAYLADELELSGVRWWCGPIGVGMGVTEFSGRKYPNPAPAVAEILRSQKFPMKTSNIQFELTTPTGAAVAVSLATDSSGEIPVVKPHKIGYGAGAKDLDQVANLLRLTVGEIPGNGHAHDEVVVLETNLDDVSGEVIGRAVERLMEAGARDVSITPVFMKKNRPGQLISIIADKAKSEHLAELLMEETGTLGVREIPVSRHISRRASDTMALEVKGKRFQVRVKRALTATSHSQSGKVEYEDLRRISNETGLSIRELQQIAKNRAHRRDT